MKKFLVICMFVITACDGIVTDYHPRRENGPIDGTFGNPRFDSNDVSYTRGNLQYLNDRTARNNAIYFASVKRYSKIDYQVAKDYVDDYHRFLNVNVEQLDEILKKDQYKMRNEEIKKKMENGTLQKYPLKDNVKVMQLLKSKKNKMAIPEYIDDYINVYYTYNNVVDNGTETVAKLDNESYFVADKINDRDSYVEFYLGTLNTFSDTATERYSERSLD